MSGIRMLTSVMIPRCMKVMSVIYPNPPGPGARADTKYLETNTESTG